MKHSYIWRGRGPPREDQDAWLKVLAIVLILVAAGPEIGFAMEMSTLLEILGAAIFLFSFRIGAKMLLMDLARSARDFVRPPFVYAMSPSAGIMCVVARSVWLVTWVLASGIIARHWAAAVGLT